MSKKNDEFYFHNFSTCISVACEAAQVLKDVLTDFDAQTLQERLDQMHAVEHKGDTFKHEMMQQIMRAFITPLERDDIVKLSENIDSVTDAIEDILIHIYMNGITQLRPDALDFADIIINCCDATKVMLEEFPNFKKSEKLNKMIIEINRIEEDGDRMYIDSMHRLHGQSTDALEIMAWKEIYGFFENVCDACEDVADVAESITIANT